MRILVLGVSARAMIESALRGGHDVVAADFFGDRDLVNQVESYSLHAGLGLPLTADGLAQASEYIQAEAVVYGSNLENYPEVLRRIARRKVLLGNTPECLEKVRDWRVLRRVCDEEGIRCPITLFRGEEMQTAVGGRWLRKRVHSGGGHGVHPWDGRPLGKAHYLQSEVRGRGASVAFVADGREGLVLGITEQLLGRAALGVSGYSWCGNVLPLDLPVTDRHRLLDQVSRMVSAVTRRFGLRGVNGLDFVVGRDADGTVAPYLVEVNPRYTGSMELMERAYGINVFSLHLEGLAGRLPKVSPTGHAPLSTFAKGIIFARKTSMVLDTDAWLAGGMSDVPFAGQRIEAGHPVCTVWAHGNGRRACLDDLYARAVAVYMDIETEGEEHREWIAHLDHRTHAQAGGWDA